MNTTPDKSFFRAVKLGTAENPYPALPSWAVTAADVAERLGRTPSATRMALARRKIWRGYARISSHLIAIYKRSQIARIVDANPPTMADIPAGYITREDALAITGLGCGSLYTYIRRFRLRTILAYIPTTSGRGTRQRRLFFKQDIIDNLDAIKAFHALQVADAARYNPTHPAYKKPTA